jgi:hypothetical protein
VPQLCIDGSGTPTDTARAMNRAAIFAVHACRNRGAAARAQGKKHGLT